MKLKLYLIRKYFSHTCILTTLLLTFSFNSFSQRQNLLFEETFEQSDLFGKWNYTNASQSYLVQQSTAFTRQGSYGAKFQSTSADAQVTTMARLTLAKQVFSNYVGSALQTNQKIERWIGLSIYIPSDFTSSSQSESVLNWQDVPSSGNASWSNPSLSLNTLNTKWSFDRLGTKYDLGDITKGAWTDFVFHIKFSWETDGLIEIWKGGTLVSQISNSNTVSSKSAVWFGAGFNGVPSGISQRVMYIDEVRIGNEKSSFSDVAAGGTSSTNQLPVANAGSNQTITLPTNSITLNGSASKDPDGAIASYTWTKVSGPAATITNGAIASTTATGLVQGTYVFALTVKDNLGASAADSITITVNSSLNQPPVANAGANQTITLPANTITLNGSASKDPDGSIASYAWTKISGPAATIANATIATTSVTGLAQGSYVFALTVKDNSGISAADSITVTVNAANNQAPVANAGANQTITLPANSVALNGSASKDPDGSIASYTWTKLSGPAATIANAASASTTATGLLQGTYLFMLTVKDNSGATNADSITITVNAGVNQAPVANAGANQTITLPTNTITLNGAGSKDPDGSIASYSWTKTAGPAATITNAAIASTTVTGLTAGTYVFTLTIKDNAGASASGSVTITVNAAVNQPPVANAGANQTINLPINSTALNGTASKDADGSITSYTWRKVSGPAATIGNASIASTTVTGLVQGTYVFELTIKDNSGASAIDSITITVNAAINQLPVANAGANQTITLPANSIILNGAASKDPDGSIASYTWVKVSGPGGNIANASIASTTATGLAQGTYVFALTIKDNSGDTDSDSITVIVNAAVNKLPVAEAGLNQTITLPVNSVSLNGSASNDPDGSITTYAWTVLSGAGATINNAATAIGSVAGLQAGQYIFELTVTDNNGATAKDQVRVTVINATDQNPVADAGSDQTITLPVNIATLDGSASADPDGSIATTTWTKISGPAAAIANTSAQSTSATGLVEGVYVFVLRVTDNNGNADTDTITVNVNAVVNKAPVANAGANLTITLPTNTATLDGAASSDPDGSIASYAWVKVSGPAATITNGTSAAAAVSDLVAGRYTFELTVTDNKGASAKAQVKIVVIALPNKRPIADAGVNQTITLPVNTITLDGSKSSDADGTIITYAWVKVSGPAASITNSSSAVTAVTGLQAGQYTFELTVTDNRGASTRAQVKTIVIAVQNQRPAADAGANQTITLPLNTVTLDGSKSSDPDGSITTYGWTKISGPAASISNGSAATATASGLQAGEYSFELTVTDNKGSIAKAQVKIIVIIAQNQPPVANAGANQTITLPVNTVTLNGSNSSDADGTISNYTWTKISGANVSISNAGTASATVAGLQEGQYTFELTVTDNKGASSKAQVKVVVKAIGNQAPIANPGLNQTVLLPDNSAILDGTGSSDPDGSIVSYSWTRIEGPAAVIISSVNTAKATASGLQAGEYIFELTVIDNKGAVSKAEIKVTVNDLPNQAPVADAGSNQLIDLPASTVTLDGKASYDPDGTIVSYTWAKTSGPAAVVIKNVNTATPTVTGLKEGQYTFELTVTDNKGVSTKAQVKITVNPNPDQPPVADAGGDIVISLPVSSATLDGSSSYDRLSSITDYQWQQLSGPSASTLSTSSDRRITVSELKAGQYVYRLTIKNAKGLSSTASVKVTVVDDARNYLQTDVYPNPSTNVINVRLTSDTIGNVIFNIYDLSGRMARKIELNKQMIESLRSQIQRRPVNSGQSSVRDYFVTPINITQLSPGAYILETIVDKQKRSTSKFIKQ